MAISQMVNGKTHRKKRTKQVKRRWWHQMLQVASCTRRPNAADVNALIVEIAMTLTSVSTKIAN